ncbi:RND family efflux transporter, MFP subunit [Abditibacterium utsteinense]|uniref:RND family efflux transporter, MFP subunit n=1 Tax=Abditibacterium utsteinense TaxID=1960156 RepID=A0A2S8SPK2_9BACT|nr:efflux RND transporter periplasmic adaptor subunit [Abditibacterium utsteinense]PQV62706.1 RND family efflux transporter, MFP subunit [Abditibacterium utsteinense]
MNNRFKKWSALCVVGAALLASAPARVWAHGGVDDEKPDPAAVATAPTTSSATQTELEVHLEDLDQSAAGTSTPLVGAKVRGFLKHDDGDLLSRVTVMPEKTPGYYLIRFAEDAPNYRFPEAGRYLLELHVNPAQGNAFDTTVNFELPKTAAAAAPLWRRVLPFILGALMLATLAWFFFKKRNTRRGSGQSTARETSPVPEAVTVALLFIVLAGLSLGARNAWAHGGVDDEKPEPAAATAPATDAAPGIALGQTSATATAGAVRVTVIARTTLAPPDVLAPGEVKLPQQTAQLLNLKTAPVGVAQLTTGISISGQIAPNPGSLVRVASLVPGRITRLNVAQGERVTRGQVVAIVESRAIGEAQSAFAQANARLQNARSNLNVVGQQARAGVFSNAPLEVARRAQAETAGDVRVQEAAVTSARGALDTATRTASAGGFANPALEAARSQSAQATEALRTAQAALTNARASVVSAQSELRRRQQLAASGAYVSRPVQEAQRALVAAQSARAAAQSEVATTRANLSRARSLVSEGLVSQRDFEAAQQAFDTATARLATSQTDETTSAQELRRQQQVGASDVNNIAEVGAARSALATAQADSRTREAEVARTATGLRLAGLSLARERTIFGAGIANRREIGTARANLQSAGASLYKARRTLQVAGATLSREQNVFRQGLNNTAQFQTARAALVSAQADAQAARNTLRLLQSSPGASVDVPVRSPIAGVVQTRDVALGELVQADAPLLSVVNLETVSLEAALFEADAARIGIGAPVTITSDAAPGRRFSGRISFIGSQVDPQTRALTARATIPNPGTLRPGVFVRGQIQTGVGKPSLAVSDGAVLDDGAAKIVFVAKGDRYERREVTLGAESGGRTEIKSGLKQGEVIVTEGGAALRAQAARGV